MKPDILSIKKKLFKIKSKNPYVVKFGARYSPENTVTVKPNIEGVSDRKQGSEENKGK